MDHRSKWLVETDWLASQHNNADIAIFDASWYLPTNNINAFENFSKAHIENAHFFDIDAISDPDTNLPHMVPSPEMFASTMRKLGIRNDQHIIIYDQQGLFSAARVWWTFRVMGHEKVSILNGGLKKWTSEGKPTTDLIPAISGESEYVTCFQRKLIKNKQDVLDAISDRSEQIIDARPADRFAGKAAEPRPGLRKGHMPGSFNMPFSIFINENGTVKSNEELISLFERDSVKLQSPIITSCGSGVTAAVVSFALTLIGHDAAAIYDGAWAEWGADENLPINVEKE